MVTENRPVTCFIEQQVRYIPDSRNYFWSFGICFCQEFKGLEEAAVLVFGGVSSRDAAADLEVLGDGMLRLKRLLLCFR